MMFEQAFLTRTGIAHVVDLLVQRGLLIEETGKNAMRRGMAWQFQIAPAVFQSFAPFMGVPLTHFARCQAALAQATD